MARWTYTDADVDQPALKSALLDQDPREIEDCRIPAEEAEAARVAKLMQMEAMDGVVAHDAVADDPFPIATPDGAAMTF